MVKLALRTYKDNLFELKTRKPSKRGFFTRTVILYLDSIQRREIEQTANHAPQKSVSFFTEEFEGTFSNRATLRTDNEEFQAVFNECRNMKESFFTCSQRENDCSKTLRAKQLQLYGKIPECDKSPYHRRLEKQFNVNFSNLPQRNWIYNGKVIISPTWKQEGKPFICNRTLRANYSEPKPKKSLTWRYLEFINRVWNGQQSDNSNTEENKEDLEDSQGDSLFIDKT